MKTAKPTPPLTHLQYAVLSSLDDNITGRELRENLRSLGIKKSGPAFYQLMARLEDVGVVKGSYQVKIVEGQPIKERRYKITGSGRRSLAHVQEFYGRLGLTAPAH